MFDLGFWELLLIGVIALIIIGPKRLPQVVRQAGRMAGKVNSLVSKFKNDINTELKADELKQTLKEQADSIGVDEIIEDFEQGAKQIKSARDELLADADPKELAKLSAKIDAEPKTTKKTNRVS